MRFLRLRKQRPLILEMLVALCLAFLIWLYAHSRVQATLDNVSIPVTLQMSLSQQDLYDLDIQGPRQVTVSFTGFSSRIRELRRLLQRGQVKAVIPCSVPEEHLKDSRFSEKLAIEPGHIAVPPGVTLVLMENRDPLQVTFHPKQKIYDPIDVPVLFLCPPDCRWRPSFRTEPAQVTLRIMGPPRDDLPPVQVYLDLSKGNLVKGKNYGTIRVQLPRDFQLESPSPQSLAFYLEEM